MQERQIDDVQDLAAEIADHAFEKHKLEFQDKHLGPEIKIETKEDFEKHILATLESSETKCFKVEDGFEKGTCYFYNQETNTFIVVPGEKSLEPTCFRPKDFEIKLDAKIEKTTREQGFEPELKNGINELLPELKKEAQLDNKQKAMTWYEVAQKRAALHTPAENKQRAPQQATAQHEPERQPPPKQAPAPAAAPTTSPKPAPTPQPARPLSPAEAIKAMENASRLARTMREREERQRREREENQGQSQGRGRSPMGDLLSSHFNRISRK